MQYFVNHDWIDRVAGEIFNSNRARFYLLVVIACATAAAAGPALATVWLGLVLLVEETRRALRAQLDRTPSSHARTPRIALDTARAAALATAPAIAWFSFTPLGATLAVLTLAALLVRAALSSKHGVAHAAIASSPYLALAALFIADGAELSALGAGACMLLIGFMFAAALNAARARTHAEREHAEIVRQLNSVLNDPSAAAWEADFVHTRLDGGERLGALVGRAATYNAIVEDGCFAAAQDRTLVRGAFMPARGPFRRIALEHDALADDGALVRLRHEGWMHTAPDGHPLRLTCVTRRVATPAPALDEAPLREAVQHAAKAFGTQASVLKTLANELSARAADETEFSAPDHNAPIAQLSATLRNLTIGIAARADLIDEQVDNLARARHESESANLAKSQFLANMSHELRTPLNAIIGYAEILQEDAEDEHNTAAIQDLNRILTAAKHLLSLINEILDLSKIEAGRMDVVPAPFDPLRMIDDLIATMRPSAEHNRNSLELIGARGRCTAETDVTKLSQCVLNLLSNACKFTRDGAVEVRFERRQCNGVEQMFFIVRDTGIGMTPEHLARLFQPFVQADPNITQQYGGTGLGLTITRRLAQLLGGDVTVESALGHGAEFTLHVPVNFADAAAALGAAAAVDAVQGPEGAPLVIVIEDEPDQRELAARALTRAGFAVQGVGGGEAGLSLARDKAPTLVLLDIYLPDRSGWRVLQALKHDPKTRDIPVVVLSVNEDRAHALALGAAEHLLKPAERDVLAATVMRYARKRQEEPAVDVAPMLQKQAG